MSNYNICFTQNLINKYIVYNKNDNYTILEFFNKYNCIQKSNGYNRTDNVLKFLQNNIILINNHYIVKYDDYINIIIDKLHTNNISIECIIKLKGGGLSDVFSGIAQIGEVFKFIIDLITWLIKFIPWFIFFIGWLFKYLLVDLFMDFTNSILLILISVFKIPFDLIISLVSLIVNSIGGWMTSIWGWDQSNLTKNDLNSNYFRGINLKKGRKCYLTNNNTVPFSILLGTIICPPLGVFMNLGITGWFNILISIILTLLYYLPGLFYALLVIYA